MQRIMTLIAVAACANALAGLSALIRHASRPGRTQVAANA